MKAVVCTKYGPPDVLQLKDVEKPVPGEKEILVKVHAATVNAGDCEMRRFDLPLLIWLPVRIYMGVFRPTRVPVLGQELAGEIVSIGRNVIQFKKGDRVFADTALGLGAWAEYKCLAEDGPVALMPAGISYGEAASIPVGGLNALHFLEQADIGENQKVLINGAGGSIGTFAVQFAKSCGAEVTAVDRTDKLEMLRSIGADKVIDYTQEDFTRNNETYDVIFDVPGVSPFSRMKRSLKKKGTIILSNSGLFIPRLRGVWSAITGSRKVISNLADPSAGQLNALKTLIEAGKIKPVVDRSFLLEETAEAHRYVERGDKKGSVVITVADR